MATTPPEADLCVPFETGEVEGGGVKVETGVEDCDYAPGEGVPGVPGNARARADNANTMTVAPITTFLT